MIAVAWIVPSSISFIPIFTGKLLTYINYSYLCTYDLYDPVRNAFDAAHYEGKWEGVGPWKSRVFQAL
jgi:hypothetical protein